MGTGFLEAVYQECLAIKFGLNEIPFAATPPIALTYKGQPLVQTYRPDFVCFDHVIVELKSVREIVGEHKAQGSEPPQGDRPACRPSREFWQRAEGAR